MKLRDEVQKTENVAVAYVARPELYATQCAACSKVFRMSKWNHNDADLGYLRGTFDGKGRVVDPESGKGMGNMFFCYVCSFACAHTMMTGGWRDLEEYKPFADADHELIRAELRITSLVTLEAELIREWESTPERTVEDLQRQIAIGRGVPVARADHSHGETKEP